MEKIYNRPRKEQKKFPVKSVMKVNKSMQMINFYFECSWCLRLEKKIGILNSLIWGDFRFW